MKERFNSLLKTIKKNFVKNKILLFVVLVAWTALIFVTLNTYKDSLGKESIGNTYSDYVTELTENVEMFQESSTVDGIEAFCFKLATYARGTNSGNIRVLVEGVDSNIVYADKLIACKSVVDNAFSVVSFDEIVNTKNDKTLKITISSDSKDGQGVGIYYSSTVEEDDEEPLPSATLTINNELQDDGALTYKYLIENKSFDGLYKTIITWTIIGFTFIILLMLLVNPKYEVLFPAIIIIFGFVFMAIIVPLSSPDEQTHYEASLQLSNMVLNSGENHLMIDKRYVDYNHLVGHYNVSGGYLRLANDLNMPMELSGKLTEMKTIDVIDVYKLCYIPQTIGIIIGRLLNLNFLKTYYLGKTMNLLVYAAVVHFALKRTPISKFLFGIIYSLPMMIQTATSYTYDNYINCLCLLLITNFLKFRYVDEKIKWQEYVFVLICCAGLAPLKFVYGFLSLIFVFVPWNRFSSKKTKILATIFLLVAGMYIVVPEISRRVIKYADDFVSSIKNKEEIEEEVYEEEYVVEEVVEQQVEVTEDVISIEEEITVDEIVEEIKEETNENITNETNTVDISGVVSEEEYKTFESIYSVKFVFTHPLETMQIFYRTIRFSIKNWFYASIGRNLSGSTLILPLNTVHLLALIPILAAFKKESYSPTLGMRVSLVGICVIVGLVIMAGFFITWTDSTQTIVEDFGGIMVQGIQGRYFSPLLPYFFMIFNNKKLQITEKFDKYLILYLIGMMFVIVVYVLSYTFIN